MSQAVPQISPVHCDLKGFFVLDVRSEAERASDLGFLAPSHHVDLAKVLSGWTPATEACKVLCVCRSGMRSMRAAQALAYRGISVYNLDGGMLAWAAAGLPRVVITPAAAAAGGPSLSLHELRDGILACFIDSMESAPLPMTPADAERVFRAAIGDKWDVPTSAALHEALASLASVASTQGVSLEVQSRNLATFSSMLAWCA